MKDGLGNLMKQAQEMQANLQKVQEDLNKLEITGQAGGGMVSVVMTGRHHVRRVSIDDSLWGDDKDMVEDLLAAALNDAVQKVDSTIQEQFSGVAGGLNLPAGIKLPF
jgi:DNA-binding YbaB/EbfC family protein